MVDVGKKYKLVWSSVNYADRRPRRFYITSGKGKTVSLSFPFFFSRNLKAEYRSSIFSRIMYIAPYL